MLLGCDSLDDMLWWDYAEWAEKTKVAGGYAGHE